MILYATAISCLLNKSTCKAHLHVGKLLVFDGFIPDNQLHCVRSCVPLQFMVVTGTRHTVIIFACFSAATHATTTLLMKLLASWKGDDKFFFITHCSCHVHICLCVRVCAYVCVCMHMCMHALHVCMHKSVCVCLYNHAYVGARLCVCVCMCVSVCDRQCVCACVCVYACICAYIC